MNEVSIFIDESGDFGEYSHLSPYYCTTFIIHEQKYSIEKQIEKLNFYLENSSIGIHSFHTAPLIRKENIYKNLSVPERIYIFNTFFYFARKLRINYKNIVVSKKHKSEMDFPMCGFNLHISYD